MSPPCPAKYISTTFYATTFSFIIFFFIYIGLASPVGQRHFQPDRGAVAAEQSYLARKVTTRLVRLGRVQTLGTSRGSESTWRGVCAGSFRVCEPPGFRAGGQNSLVLALARRLATLDVAGWVAARSRDSGMMARSSGTIAEMRFLVTLEPDEDGWIVVDCPALPGCVSQGRTQEEALRNISEAIQLSLETRRANGLPVDLEVVEVEVEAPS